MLNADNERGFEVDAVPFVHISLFSEATLAIGSSSGLRGYLIYITLHYLRYSTGKFGWCPATRVP